MNLYIMKKTLLTYSLEEAALEIEFLHIIHGTAQIVCMNQEEKDFLAGYFLLWGVAPEIIVDPHSDDAITNWVRWFTYPPTYLA